MFIHPRFPSANFIICESIRRHGNDRDRLRILAGKSPDLFGGLAAIHDRHHDIHQDHIECTFGCLGKSLDSLFSVPCFRDDGALFCDNKFRDLHVELIIFDKKNTDTLDRRLGFFGRFLGFADCLVDQEGELHRERRPFAPLAGKGNAPAHGFREFLCDRHAKSRTVVEGFDTFVFASEGFKDSFLVLLTHTDPGILTNKRIESAAILTLVFPEAEYDFPMIFIVLHSVTHDIHQKTLQVTWTAYEIPVCN